VGVACLVALVGIALGLALGSGTTPNSASTYGPANSRFVVAFAVARPRAISTFCKNPTAISRT
jgi:hypothetical protein